MKKLIQKRGAVVVLGIVLILILPSCGSIGRSKEETSEQQIISANVSLSSEKTAPFTLYIIGKNGLQKQEKILPASTVLEIYGRYQDLKKEMAANPRAEKTQRIIKEFLTFLGENNALPVGMTTDQLNAFLQPSLKPPRYLRSDFLPLQTRASEWFCNFATTGEGAAFPIIILPRLIPFILAPIPRAFVWWSTPEGVTSVGGLISHTGFIAGGQQQGIALGFWGIGFSIFLPPIDAYGIFGYALYTRVNAEAIEFWPPNNPPEITQTDPADGEQMVPISTSQLSFSIDDVDNDRMSYNVTTDPDIGSGSGGLKPSGTYSVPISGLESLTTYSWHIQLTDGKDPVEKTMTFTTEPAAPIVTNIIPPDKEKDVPMDLPSLQFTLKDYQGDAMEYTVETSPNIGSKHEIGVHDGTYTVPISGMTHGALYRWYLNVTDGTHWTRKTYSFQTGYPSQFDPFEYGWRYRKQITINHSQVADDLSNFPILLSATDLDFTKAQATGADFQFMSGPGVATKRYYEIESFDHNSGTLVAWVNIPSLSTSTDTTLYLYYGNYNCTDQQYPEKVWSSSFIAVWHLNNDPTGKIYDSTTNKNNGNPRGGMTSSNLMNGKIGPCLQFDGVNDFISFSEFTESFNTGSCTAWVQTTSSERAIVWSDATQNSIKPYILFGKHDNGDFWFGRDSGGGSSNYQGFTPVGMNDGQWHQATWESMGSGNGNKFYFDGQPITLNWQDGLDPNGVWFDDQPTNTHSIGALDRSVDGYEWNGLLDEIRIANTPLSAGWIATEYANQNNPSIFLSIGPEESGP